jgi:hypothetical protein
MVEPFVIFLVTLVRDCLTSHPKFLLMCLLELNPHVWCQCVCDLF